MLYINILYIRKTNWNINDKNTNRSILKVQKNNTIEGNMPINLLADRFSPQGIIGPQVLNSCFVE